MRYWDSPSRLEASHNHVLLTTVWPAFASQFRSDGQASLRWVKNMRLFLHCGEVGMSQVGLVVLILPNSQVKICYQFIIWLYLYAYKPIRPSIFPSPITCDENWRSPKTSVSILMSYNGSACRTPAWKVISTDFNENGFVSLFVHACLFVCTGFEHISPSKRTLKIASGTSEPSLGAHTVMWVSSKISDRGKPCTHRCSVHWLHWGLSVTGVQYSLKGRSVCGGSTADADAIEANDRSIPMWLAQLQIVIWGNQKNESFGWPNFVRSATGWVSNTVGDALNSKKTRKFSSEMTVVVRLC